MTYLDTAARSCIRALKERLVLLLRQAFYDVLADKVESCCSEFVALACPNGHVFDPVPTFRCRFRLCPDCVRERAKTAFARIYPKLIELKNRYPADRVVLVTLTVKSSFDTLKLIAKTFKRCLSKFRRSKAWKEHIRGAVVGFEITHSREKGWHFHAHILAFRKRWWPQDELAEAWQQITEGWGQIVDILEVKNLRDGLREVLKYIFKPSDLINWGADQVAEFNQLGRMKLAECYGELRGIEVESQEDPSSTPDEHQEHIEGGPCPTCGLALSSVRIPRLVYEKMALAHRQPGPAP